MRQTELMPVHHMSVDSLQRDEYVLATQRVIEAQASATRLSAEAARQLAQASTAATPIPVTVAPSATDAGVVAASAVAAVQEAIKQASAKRAVV